LNLQCAVFANLQRPLLLRCGMTLLQVVAVSCPVAVAIVPKENGVGLQPCLVANSVIARCSVARRNGNRSDAALRGFGLAARLLPKIK
jgi:hypothetical protein